MPLGPSAHDGASVSQRTLLLTALRDAGPAGLCITDLGRLDPTAVLTARNRIAELRAGGLRIDGKPCRVHRHRGSVQRYWIVADPEQLSLPA